MNKKTIALTLLSLASVFALSTTAVKAEETTPTVDATETTTTTGSDVTINPGSLSVTNVSESLEFGALTIKGDGKEQTAYTTNGLNLTVADLRGTHEGWNVKVSHDGLKHENNVKLENATIKLNDGKLTNSLEDNNKPTIKAPIVINEAQAPVSIADTDQGMGTWSHEWKSEDISLIIPDKAAQDMYKGQYSTTITWTLAATPKAETPTAE